MGLPEVWFVIPSANEANCAARLPVWRDMGYRVAVLQDTVRFACAADVVVEAARYPGWPASVNRMFREVVPAHAPVIVSGGDDMLPDPTMRAGEIAEQFLDHFGGSLGVMQPHGDAFEETQRFCGSPWLGRAWMERAYGGEGGMCAAYMHHFADDELYWVSRCTGRLWCRPDLTQRHEHFRRTGDQAPDYWQASVQGNDRVDVLTFLHRSSQGFPGHACTGDDAPAFDADVFRSEYDGRAERYWTTHYCEHDDRGADAVSLVEQALAGCAACGHTRVAIYGAGRHTRKAGEALCDPPVEVVAVIDDDATRHGGHMWNIPIVPLERAAMLRVDAVVISSDTREGEMAARARTLSRSGIDVVRLYGDPRCEVHTRPLGVGRAT